MQASIAVFQNGHCFNSEKRFTDLDMLNMVKKNGLVLGKISGS